MLQGSLHPDFAAVAVSLARIIPRRGPGGAAVCVYHRGEKVVDIWGGTRDAAGNPWEADTLSLSFSTTKGAASTLLHVFADRGHIDYDAVLRDEQGLMRKEYTVDGVHPNDAGYSVMAPLALAAIETALSVPAPTENKRVTHMRSR